MYIKNSCGWYSGSIEFGLRPPRLDIVERMPFRQLLRRQHAFQFPNRAPEPER